MIHWKLSIVYNNTECRYNTISVDFVCGLVAPRLPNITGIGYNTFDPACTLYVYTA